ncbi:MAG TPA: zf-HC2 domain-containing protein [Verrucomicrobiae bacterium]|nr:zf-HC2 domain-containing protein [Verrucomicrobiae bacterium]
MSDILEFYEEPGAYCPERRDDIVSYIFDEMGPGAAEAFAAHLASCTECREEVDSLRETLFLVAEATPPAGALAGWSAADGPAGGSGRDGSSWPEGSAWEDEWTQLRRRLLASGAFDAEEAPVPGRRRARIWLVWAASVAIVGSLAFSVGLWRGVEISARRVAPGGPGGELAREGGGLSSISGASVGNYFDNLDDFSRDTHNFLRRTRMVLMEFSNLGADTDPTFFRQSSRDLLEEVTRYQEVARRVQSRKLADLLDQIASVLTTISRVDPSNRAQVIADVRMTLNLTGLIGTLDLLDTTGGRDNKRHSNV